MVRASRAPSLRVHRRNRRRSVSLSRHASVMPAPRRYFPRSRTGVPRVEQLPGRALMAASATAAGSTLAGRMIVITRPAEQAEALARLIREYGGVPLIFPAI